MNPSVKDRILDVLGKAPAPMTGEQIATILALPYKIIAPRISTLAGEGQIYDTGQRCTDAVTRRPKTLWAHTRHLSVLPQSLPAVSAYKGAPKRPVMRYHGGKWIIAPWIVSQFPAHRIYVEPFGGAASVLLRKPRSYAEIYNDLAGDIVNVFRVLQDDAQAQRLIHLLTVTPFARAEFERTYEPSGDPVERARRTIFRTMAGFGSSASTKGYKTGFRANANKSGSTPARDWVNYPRRLPAIIDRLRGVVIENRPAVEVMQQQDSPSTLHYVDPPYVHATRRESNGRDPSYEFEMTDADHEALAGQLSELEGFVVLSGYPSDLYDRLYTRWNHIERPHYVATSKGSKISFERLWFNDRAWRARQDLFA